MAGKKNSGKNKKYDKSKKPEKALTVDKNLQNEQIAVMPDAPEPLNEPVPVQEVEQELRQDPAGGEELALTQDENLANEQVAAMPDAPEPVNGPVSVQEVERELSRNPEGGEELALTQDENFANEQVAIMPDAPEPVNEPAPVQEVEKELSRNPAGDQEKTCAKAGKQSEKAPRLPSGITPRPLFAGNPYLPKIATVAEIIEETHNIRTLRLILDGDDLENFHFEPGQVGQISVFGAGEATFVINSPPSEKHYLQFSVMKAGEVTDAIHRLSAGDKVGLRAPLGNFFPYNDWKGKNIFFVGGGIGMAPIRTIMLYLLEHKQDYGKISLLYGARSPKDMAYSYELDAWMHDPNLDCHLCIDNPYEQWHHKVGLIPKVLEDINPSPENTVAVLCGPPIMIKFTLQTLSKLGFEPENIVTTLEKRMKCGIGICGRCNIGDRYVCVDGPVFTMKELNELPQDY